MLKKLGLYYRTVKHLKPIQIRYRLWYYFRRLVRKLTAHQYPLSITQKSHSLQLIGSCPSSVSGHPSQKNFTFLNQSHTFHDTIDWNIDKYGKLWAYNLNYFDYLHQPGLTKVEGLDLIREFIDHIQDNREGLEPYPISLRGINWIKFLSTNKIEDSAIDASLYAQYNVLADNLEYHLLGNHLLENGCSLLFGACYFRDENLFQKAEDILKQELEEQVLNDGGHFERSPMYHQILLERLLDCYNLLQKNSGWRQDPGLEHLVRDSAQSMLGWLKSVTFSNGDIPLVNDSAIGIAPTTKQIESYATALGIKAEPAKLGDSGYRKATFKDFELFMDVGAIGPDYQPGHAHADTFSFVLYRNGEPVIIDPGVSTYENNERRHLERSTRFHNTVELNHADQSEVWSAFRVGSRAHIQKLAEEYDNSRVIIEATHDGYKKRLGLYHTRRWEIIEGKVVIVDTIEPSGSETSQCAYLHFAPELSIVSDKNTLRCGPTVVAFEGADSIETKKYDCPDGFNRFKRAERVEIRFRDKLTTTVHL